MHEKREAIRSKIDNEISEQNVSSKDERIKCRQLLLKNIRRELSKQEILDVEAAFKFAKQQLQPLIKSISSPDQGTVEVMKDQGFILELCELAKLEILNKMKRDASHNKLKLDVIKHFSELGLGRIHSADGISNMVRVSKNKALNNSIKYNEIVKEAKHRTSRTSSFAGFFKNSLLLHGLSTRTDTVDLIYWALAEEDANRRFNPDISTLEQLLIAQLKRQAIAIFKDEIRQLKIPSVGTSLFGW